MRFSCHGCGTRYSIADEKVRGKVLRVRCKKCGESILVKEDPEQLEAVGAGADEGSDDGDTTRVVKQDEVQRAMLQAGLSSQAPGAIPTGKFVANKTSPARSPVKPAPAAPPPSAKPADKKVWHAMLGGKQSGPFTRGELRALVDAGQFTVRTYVWKEGMSGWLRSKEVADLADLLGEPATSPPPPPPPSSEEQRTVVEQGVPVEVQAALATASKPAPARAPASKAAPARSAKPVGPDDVAGATLPPEPVDTAALAKAAAEKKAALARAATEKAAAEKAAAEKAAAEKAAAEKAAAEKAAAEKAAAAKVAAEKAAAEQEAQDAAARADREAAEQAERDAEAQAAADAEEATSAGLFDEAGEDEERTAAGDDAPIANPFDEPEEATAAGDGDMPFVADTKPPASVGDKTPVPGSISLDALLDGVDLAPAASTTTKAAEPPTESGSTGPLVGGAAAGPANDDPFANVPDAPGFQMPVVGETTNAIIRASGAKERNWGKLAAAAVLMIGALGAAAYMSVKYAGELVVPEAPTKTERPKFAAIDPAQLDQATLDVLSGENIRRAEREKAEAEARARAEAEAKAKAEAEAKARASGGGGVDDMNAMLAADIDTEGAIKTVAADKKAPVEVSPDQLALLAQLQADKSRRGVAGPKSFVTDDAFDVKKAAATGDDAGLSPEVISKKFEEAKPGIQNCIGNAMRRNPNQKLGKVVITVTIAPSGIVQAATFSNKTMADTELGGCLRTTLKRVVFPSFEGEPFDVEFPLVLGAG